MAFVGSSSAAEILPTSGVEPSLHGLRGVESPVYDPESGELLGSQEEPMVDAPVPCPGMLHLVLPSSFLLFYLF